MSKLVNPIPLFLDGRGTLLDGGSIYIGAAGADPEIVGNQIAIYFDQAQTIPAAQPLRTLGGAIVNGQNQAFVFFAEADYSLKVRDVDGNVVTYLANANTASGPQYQPLDSDLTAIAALATTAYGRGLLLLANQAALKTATGIPDCLPLTGGTVSANILRAGGGSYTYFSDPAMVGGRIFITAEGAADPTGLTGDVWFRY